MKIKIKHENLCDGVKAVLRGEFLTLMIYFRKEKKNLKSMIYASILNGQRRVKIQSKVSEEMR